MHPFFVTRFDSVAATHFDILENHLLKDGSFDKNDFDSLCDIFSPAPLRRKEYFNSPQQMESLFSILVQAESNIRFQVLMYL